MLSTWMLSSGERSTGISGMICGLTLSRLASSIVKPASRKPSGSMSGNFLYINTIASVANHAISIITLYRPTHGPVPDTAQRKPRHTVR